MRLSVTTQTSSRPSPPAPSDSASATRPGPPPEAIGARRACWRDGTRDLLHPLHNVRAAALERSLARGLLLMRDAGLYRKLGFVRLGDYVLERLGLSYRTAEELMLTEEALHRLPLVAAAFDRNAISSSHVRLLVRVADNFNEEFWVGLARRVSLRDLRASIEESIRCQREAMERGGGAEAFEPASPAAAAAHSKIEGEPRLRRLEIRAPAWVALFWRDSVIFVRKLVGSSLPQGACLGIVLAEASTTLAPAATSERSSFALEASDAGGRDGGRSPCLEPHAPASLEKGESAASAPDNPPIGEGRTNVSQGPAPPAHDARAVDRSLRVLVRARQRREAAVAEHLRAAGASRSYRARGFSSLEAYAADLFDVSPARLYGLLKLHRTLRSLPALREAFLAGRLTLKQVLALDGVASPSTEVAWIGRASAVTLRRLEDEISFWRDLRETRPEVWGLLQGEPLPHGIALVPGRPPRLLASAIRVGSGGRLNGSLSPVTAEDLLRALQADEAATPLPLRICRIRMLVEPGVDQAWKETVAHCRAAIRGDLEEWEGMEFVLREFWRVWDNAETRRQRRENPTLERDGWRCAAPGCRTVGTGRLHEHHIRFRSADGAAREPSNLVTLCVGHHLGLLHEEKIRCSGLAPDALVWGMGTEPGRAPFFTCAGAERIVATS